MIFSGKGVYPYFPFKALTPNKGPISVEAVSKILGFSKKDIKKTLKKLLQTRLIKQISSEEFAPLQPGYIFVYPPLSPGQVCHGLEKLQSFWRAMEKKKGKRSFYWWTTFRASQADLGHYFPYLRQTLLGSEVYSTLEPQKDSALFLVEATVKKLLPF